MTPISFLLIILMHVCFCKMSNFFVFLLPHDCELEYNLMILVIYVVRYVSLYLLQIWLEIFSS